MPPKFGSLIKQKQGFLVSVYSTLIFQLLVTFGIIYSFRNHPQLSNATKQTFIFYLLLSLGILLLISLVPMPTWLKLILFTLFAVLEGAMLHSASVLLPKGLIDKVLISTIGIFIAFTIIGVVLAYLGIDLSWMGLILLGCLIGLLVGSLVTIFLDKERTKGLHKFLTIFALVLFSVYVMFETNIILQKNYNGDFITASIDFYLDFLNIFANLLSLQSE